MKNINIKVSREIAKWIEIFFDLISNYFWFLIVAYFDFWIYNTAFGNVSTTIKGFFSHTEQFSYFSFPFSILSITLVSFVFLSTMIYKPFVSSKNFSSILTPYIVGTTLTFALMTLITLIPGLYFHPYIFAVTYIIVLPLGLGFKYFFYFFTRKAYAEKIIIIGPQNEAKQLARKFLLDESHFKTIKYIIFEDDKIISREVFTLINNVDSVYLTASLSEKNKNELFTYSVAKAKKSAYILPKMYEIGLNKSRLDQVSDTMLFEVLSLNLLFYQRFIKRFFDLIITSLIILITSPFFLIIPIIIKLTDGGDIYYKQKKLTINNTPFTLYKYRTYKELSTLEMEKIYAEEDDEKKYGEKWSQNNRYIKSTRIGNFLRRSKLSNLPELFSVIKGDMSLVGPQSVNLETYEKHFNTNPDYAFRSNIKVGLTGIAQSVGKFDIDFEEKFRYDILYIHNYSIFNDVKIFLLTIRTLFLKRQPLLSELSFEELLNKHNLSYEQTSSVLVFNSGFKHSDETQSFKVIKNLGSRELHFIANAKTAIIGEYSFVVEELAKTLINMNISVEVVLTPLKTSPVIIKELLDSPFFTLSTTNPLNRSQIQEVVIQSDYIIYTSDLNADHQTQLQVNYEDDCLKNILESCRLNSKLRKFVYLSNSRIYGETLSNLLVENEIGTPKTSYDLNRQTLENYVALYHRNYSIPSIRLRLFDVFSLDEASSIAMTTTAHAINSLNKNQSPRVFIDPQTRICPLFIDDAVEAILAATTSNSSINGNVYNINNELSISVEEFLRRVKILQDDQSLHIQYLPNVPASSNFSSVSVAAAIKDLSFTPSSINATINKALTVTSLIDDKIDKIIA